MQTACSFAAALRFTRYIGQVRLGRGSRSREGAQAIPLPSEKIYEALLRRSRTSVMRPETASARVAAMANSEVTEGPPVSARAVAVGLAVAVAVPVGLAVVPPLTVTLPTMPRSSCGMQK